MAHKENRVTQENTAQAMKIVESMKAVNLDEVTVEIIEVKVRHYKSVDVLDDDGNPMLDEDGKPLKYRKPALRTAHIQNIVTIDDYEEAMAMSGKTLTEQEALSVMSNICLRIWQVSEPWMTRKMLIEGIDFDGITGLFARFFDKMSQTQTAKA